MYRRTGRRVYQLLSLTVNQFSDVDKENRNKGRKKLADVPVCAQLPLGQLYGTWSYLRGCLAASHNASKAWACGFSTALWTIFTIVLAVVVLLLCSWYLVVKYTALLEEWDFEGVGSEEL